MNNNIQPLSKRSKRILEEASRHLRFAERALTRLSLYEYQGLTVFCMQTVTEFNLSERLAEVKYLSEVINVYMAERSRP